jgi:Tfp pilus assembly protein PilX
MKNKKYKNGFVLLMTLIIISITLVVGLGVFDIISREVLISGIQKESQKAFFSANSGIECAYYWDLKGKFASSSYSIECAGQSISGLLDSASTTFFTVNLGNGACVKINVNKNVLLPLITYIYSHGYNLDCDSTDSRKVERGIEINY